MFKLSTQEEALDTIEFYLDQAVDAGCKPNVCFAPIDGVYEILGMFYELPNGECIGLDNEYVSEEVAFAISANFGIEIIEVE